MLITTERLVIRPIEKDDCEAIYRYAGDPSIDMMMFLPRTYEETKEFVEFAVSEWAKEEPEDREFVILLNGDIIGGVNLECEGAGIYEIGWTLRGDMRGKGYATEAAKALVDYAFGDLNAEEIRAHCDSRNHASEKVMRKLGMVLVDGTGTRYYPKTGVSSGEYLYAITKPKKATRAYPLPSSEYIFKKTDIWSEIVTSVVPEYMKDLADKYNMHFKVISCTENAMFNDKCCIIFAIDNRDGVIMGTTLLENGRRVEYILNGFLIKAFDASDREGISTEWRPVTEQIRDQLTVAARGLDSKWSGLLKGDMSWFEDFKKTAFYYELKMRDEKRNKILDEIIAWQRAQNAGASQST